MNAKTKESRHTKLVKKRQSRNYKAQTKCQVLIKRETKPETNQNGRKKEPLERHWCRMPVGNMGKMDQGGVTGKHHGESEQTEKHLRDNKD